MNFVRRLSLCLGAFVPSCLLLSMGTLNSYLNLTSDLLRNTKRSEIGLAAHIAILLGMRSQTRQNSLISTVVPIETRM